MPFTIEMPVTIDLKTAAGRAWLLKLVAAINTVVSDTSTLFNDSEGNPANVGTTADGTSTYAARRDHVHAIVMFNDAEGNPENIADTPADGTSTYAARRDHAHFLDLGAGLTAPLTQITHTAPGTPDYAIQDLVNSSAYGFVTKDEGNTVLKVIQNLQVRLDQLEDRLQALGSLP